MWFNLGAVGLVIREFGAWSTNFMTEWHARYGGPGVMIYWHVERKSVCIYSQLKSCSASEVAAMIEGLLRHSTNAEIDRNSPTPTARRSWRSRSRTCSTSGCCRA